MSQFDDLNEALAALKAELKTTTSATQVVSSLQDIATKTKKHVSTINSQLKDCETSISEMAQAISTVNRSIEKLGRQSDQQWKSAVKDVLVGIETKYVTAVENQVQEVSGEFQGSIESLRAESIQQADIALQHNTAVENRLKACEDKIMALKRSISNTYDTVQVLDSKIIGQWKESTTTVTKEMGREYVDAVRTQVKDAGDAFSANIKALRQEWMQREHALQQARKWVLILSIILIMSVIGIAGFLYERYF